ncbi:hypothetical protein HanRHA438_Chr13g0606421 [Helianthus annuus]|nr:hypothetical protein HanRHA438_Chr13g0606421 [Helianthus annuus]
MPHLLKGGVKRRDVTPLNLVNTYERWGSLHSTNYMHTYTHKKLTFLFKFLAEP